jgi:hypothetical protein
VGWAGEHEALPGVGEGGGQPGTGAGRLSIQGPPTQILAFRSQATLRYETETVFEILRFSLLLKIDCGALRRTTRMEFSIREGNFHKRYKSIFPLH